MRQKKIWLYLMTSIIFFGCWNYREVEVGKINGIKVNDISLKSADVSVLIPIVNPNNFSFKVKNLEADVFLNEIRVGVIGNKEKIKINNNSNEVYEFPLKVEYSNPLSGLLVLVKMLGKEEADIRIKGFLKVGSGIFSKKIPINEQNTVKIFKD